MAVFIHTAHPTESADKIVTDAGARLKRTNVIQPFVDLECDDPVEQLMQGLQGMYASSAFLRQMQHHIRLCLVVDGRGITDKSEAKRLLARMAERLRPSVAQLGCDILVLARNDGLALSMRAAWSKSEVDEEAAGIDLAELDAVLRDYNEYRAAGLLPSGQTTQKDVEEARRRIEEYKAQRDA